MDDLQQKVIQAVIGPGLSEERLYAALEVLQTGTTSEAEDDVRFLSDRDACAYCGHIARSTLRHWRSQGLRSHRVGGRRLYRTTDLDQFVVQSEKPSKRGR